MRIAPFAPDVIDKRFAVAPDIRAIPDDFEERVRLIAEFPPLLHEPVVADRTLLSLLASASQMDRFETASLAAEKNPSALAEADQDRREGRRSRSLCPLPDRRGRDPTGLVR